MEREKVESAEPPSRGPGGTEEIEKLLSRFENALSHAWANDEHVSYRKGAELHGRVDIARTAVLDALARLVRERDEAITENIALEKDKRTLATGMDVLRADLATARERIAVLEEGMHDVIHASSDLGIVPAAWTDADGKRTERDARGDGYNDAVMRLGAALDVIAAQCGIDCDHDDDNERPDPWAWSEPLDHLRARLDSARAILERAHDAALLYGDDAVAAEIDSWLAGDGGKTT